MSAISVSLLVVLCCATAAAMPTPLNPDEVIFEFAYDPNDKLFTPISQETVKHVYGISKINVQTYDVNGADYIIQNHRGYPYLRHSLHTSSETSEAQRRYKIGCDSVMGHFLYPTPTFASKAHTIEDMSPGEYGEVKEIYVYRIGNRGDEYFFYRSPHQYDPDILSTSTATPSTTEASETTVSSQDTSTPVPEISTTESVDPITSAPLTSTPKLTAPTSEASDVTDPTPDNSLPEPDISTCITMPPSVGPNVTPYAVIAMLLIAIIVILACVTPILREYFWTVNSASSNYV